MNIFRTITGNGGGGDVFGVNVDVSASFYFQDARVVGGCGAAVTTVSLYIIDAPVCFVSLTVCVMGVNERGNYCGGLQVRSLLWTRLEVGRGWPSAINRLLQLVGRSL